MLGSILVGLDGSDFSKSALKLAIQWAKQSNAVVAGIGILDQPSITQGEFVPLGGSSFKEHRDEHRLAEAQKKINEFLGEFEKVCQEGQVPCKPISACGTPHEEIMLAAQEFDLIMLGCESHFGFATEDTHCDTLFRVIKEAPRPVVVVPKEYHHGEKILISYDGSLQAARALQVFQAVGLNHLHEIHVISVQKDHSLAQLQTKRAGKFLEYHHINTHLHPVVSSSSPAEVIQEYAKDLNASLLVMGAYGQSMLQEFFFGSVTKTMLQNTSIPIFLYH